MMPNASLVKCGDHLRMIDKPESQAASVQFKGGFIGMCVWKWKSIS